MTPSDPYPSDPAPSAPEPAWSPEIDPAGTPEEAPSAPDAPDDPLGRPYD